MAIYRLRKEQIADVLGLAQGEPSEASLSSVQVRLEEMFREAAGQANNLVLVHGDDLEKIVKYDIGWRAGAKTIQSRKFRFTAEEGFTDSLVREINGVPGSFVSQLLQIERLIFCHSPMFHYRRSQGEFEVCIWMHVVLAPELPLPGEKREHETT